MKLAYIVSVNLFGPRDKFDAETGNFVPSLIKKFHDAKKGGTTVTIWGDGSAQRDLHQGLGADRAGRHERRRWTGRHGQRSGLPHPAYGRCACRHRRNEWPDRMGHSKPNGQGYRAYDLSKIGGLRLRPAYPIRAGLKETWD